MIFVAKNGSQKYHIESCMFMCDNVLVHHVISKTNSEFRK